MGHKLVFACDHLGCHAEAILERPEPSSIFSQHFPEGWVMMRFDAGTSRSPDNPYYTFCPFHAEMH
jgi:hypothetical protein